MVKDQGKDFSIGSIFRFSGYALLAATCMGFVEAQETLVPTKESQSKEIIVTGSRIKKVDINNLSPVFTISREEIDKFGYSNVKDVIDNLTQNAGGTFDNSATFGFTPGASAVNLRGVGFGQTLTLIDGRRLPIYPVGLSGTTNFVDLSSIPMAFVERIEVLTDGASAVYGSDAVAGVINVITRQDIQGTSVNYRTSFTSDGGYETQRFNLLTGARAGETQLDVILDYWLQDPLWAADRDYAKSDVANPRGMYSFGGASFLAIDSQNIIQDPNCGTSAGALRGDGVPNVNLPIYNTNDSWCGYDRSKNRQLIAPQERFSLMTRIHYDLNEETEFFSRIGLSRLTTSTQTEPNFYGGSELTGFGSLVPNNGGVLPIGASNNPTTGTALEEAGFFIRRMAEFGPRRSQIEDNAVNLLAGFKGTMADGAYDWQFGFSYNKTDLDVDSNNIHLSGLNAAVDNGLDLFQPIPQETVDLLSFVANEKASSTNRVFDFSINGDLDVVLDDGPIKFAIALEQVSESYFDHPDPIVANGDGFDGSSEGDGERKHTGIGGELNLPFYENFEVDLALRWDDYDDQSDVNSALSPRISVAYNPVESLLTRLSWGRSFRAPDMQRLFGGVTKGFVDLVDPENNNTVVQSVQLFTVPSLELSEERGTNVNLGFVWQASDDLDVTFDIYHISLDDIVLALSPQFIVDACSEFDAFCELVSRDSSNSLNGSDAFVITGPINFAKQETEGVDLTVNYGWKNSLGNWSTRLNTTWIKNFYFQAVQDISKVENIGLGLFPEYRTNLMLDWQKDQVGATIKLSYVDRVAGQFCMDCRDSQYISSWTTINTNFRYQYSNFTRIGFGINNLFNKTPPQDPTQNNWPWFTNAGGYHNAIGRELYLQLDVNF